MQICSRAIEQELMEGSASNPTLCPTHVFISLS